MKIEQLEHVVELIDKHAIVQELKKLGYHDAGMDKKYRDFPIPTILKGSERETEWRMDCTGRFEFKGSIYTNVEGADGAEFIAISVNKINKEKEMSIPYSLMWFVKEDSDDKD